MRWLASLLLLGSLLLSIAFAEPIPPRQGDAVVRRERVFGRNNATVGGGNAQLRDDIKLGRAGAQRATADEADATRNYLVTLDRSITNGGKDKILDVLLRLGAVVKQEYNYRVYKGILFTIPTASDKGLAAWSTALAKEDGVKYVERDEIVRANAPGAES